MLPVKGALKVALPVLARGTNKCGQSLTHDPEVVPITSNPDANFSKSMPYVLGTRAIVS